jgi:N-sulfoglucosamine sulfohydrolase
MRDTGDPLLDGPVAPPPGAELNDPDQRSADDPRMWINPA